MFLLSCPVLSPFPFLFICSHPILSSFASLCPLSILCISLSSTPTMPLSLLCSSSFYASLCLLLLCFFLFSSFLYTSAFYYTSLCAFLSMPLCLLPPTIYMSFPPTIPFDSAPSSTICLSLPVYVSLFFPFYYPLCLLSLLLYASCLYLPFYLSLSLSSSSTVSFCLLPPLYLSISSCASLCLLPHFCSFVFSHLHYASSFFSKYLLSSCLLKYFLKSLLRKFLEAGLKTKTKKHVSRRLRLPTGQLSFTPLSKLFIYYSFLKQF